MQLNTSSATSQVTVGPIAEVAQELLDAGTRAKGGSMTSLKGSMRSLRDMEQALRVRCLFRHLPEVELCRRIQEVVSRIDAMTDEGTTPAPSSCGISFDAPDLMDDRLLRRPKVVRPSGAVPSGRSSIAAERPEGVRLVGAVPPGGTDTAEDTSSLERVVRAHLRGHWTTSRAPYARSWAATACSRATRRRQTRPCARTR